MVRDNTLALCLGATIPPQREGNSTARCQEQFYYFLELKGRGINNPSPLL